MAKKKPKSVIKYQTGTPKTKAKMIAKVKEKRSNPKLTKKEKFDRNKNKKIKGYKQSGDRNKVEFILQTRKHTAKHGGPSTIIGYPSKKGKGIHKVEYDNTWYNRVKRLDKHIG